jgi:hypothetical protein
MKAGTKSVRGTPVNHVGPKGALIGNKEGYGAKAGPKGMSGTVNKQYEGDQKGNREVGISTGTPYQSQYGNPDETSVTREDHRYGVSLGAGGQDYNDPKANGDGTMFADMSRAEGYTPPNARTADSPVRKGSPVFDTHDIRAENLSHIGEGIGAAPSQAADDLVKIGGVMGK